MMDCTFITKALHLMDSPVADIRRQETSPSLWKCTFARRELQCLVFIPVKHDKNSTVKVKLKLNRQTNWLKLSIRIADMLLCCWSFKNIFSWIFLSVCIRWIIQFVRAMILLIISKVEHDTVFYIKSHGSSFIPLFVLIELQSNG